MHCGPSLWEAMLSGQTGAQPPRHQLLTCSMIVTAADVMRPGLTVDVLLCAFAAREQSGRGRAASLSQVGQPRSCGKRPCSMTKLFVRLVNVMVHRAQLGPHGASTGRSDGARLCQQETGCLVDVLAV